MVLPVPGGPTSKHTFRNVSAQIGKLFGVAEKFNDLFDLSLGLL
jgi:hypothetical protein